MKENSFEVYENNGGGLFLVILDGEGNPTRIFENWEYGEKGNLAEALDQLIKNPGVCDQWDGDLMERLENSTITDIYREISEGADLVAWSREAGWEHLPAERMGAAANDALIVPAQESGSCPLCGGHIKYGEHRETCGGMMFLWSCPDCGATGEEWSILVFDGHHNVKKKA
jgi:hypothetical protein